MALTTIRRNPAVAEALEAEVQGIGESKATFAAYFH
jgi:hypothetical protein